jgi:hypothetical protein
MFNVDFKKLTRWLIPAFLRKPRLVALISCFSYPLARIYDQFIINREKNLYKLNHCSQVFSMENVLNDRFDATDRRIYITDGFAKDREYIYTRNELKNKYLGKLFVWNRVDYADTGIDFIVWIPVKVFITAQDEIELRTLVNFYKLASKRFKIYKV